MKSSNGLYLFITLFNLLFTDSKRLLIIMFYLQNTHFAKLSIEPIDR
jgi:hypothetical protein